MQVRDPKLSTPMQAQTSLFQIAIPTKNNTLCQKRDLPIEQRVENNELKIEKLKAKIAFDLGRRLGRVERDLEMYGDKIQKMEEIIAQIKKDNHRLEVWMTGLQQDFEKTKEICRKEFMSSVQEVIRCYKGIQFTVGMNTSTTKRQLLDPERECPWGGGEHHLSRVVWRDISMVHFCSPLSFPK